MCACACACVCVHACVRIFTCYMREKVGERGSVSVYVHCVCVYKCM